jgi:hypothetical protein
MNALQTVGYQLFSYFDFDYNLQSTKSRKTQGVLPSDNSLGSGVTRIQNGSII